MNRRLMFLPLALLALGACDSAGRDESAVVDSAPSAAAAATNPDVEHAVAVYRGIEAAPAAADSVLAAHGLTQAGLDSLMYRIAADSASSAEYTRLIR